jgi:parallel beta-helix repeat protein
MLALPGFAQQRRTLVIQPAEATVEVGKSVTFRALLDGKVVTPRWTVNSPGVATVAADGTVTGRSVGKARIFARTKNIDAFADITVVSSTDPTPPPSPPPGSNRGPQSTIVCPSGATSISPGESLKTLIETGAPFICIKAGVHQVTASITPRTGQTIIGQYSAILDGTGWTTSDETAAAFRCTAGNAATDVTIKNLIIRNMPKKGIYDAETCFRWSIDNNEIHNSQWGAIVTAGSLLRANRLHHNGQGVNGGNYNVYVTAQYGSTMCTLLENNEIAYGGVEQKAMNTGCVNWRNNWVHHNDRDGIWNDGEGNGGIIEGNLVEDNARTGIHIELSYGFIVRNNTVRRSGDQAIMLSTSRDNRVENNILEDNFRGLAIFLSCGSMLQSWPWKPDLSNNLLINNSVLVGTSPSGQIAAYFSTTSDCSARDAQGNLLFDVTPYLDGTKNNRFESNKYAVPDINASWWLWNGWRNWAQWQELGHDVNGTMILR